MSTTPTSDVEALRRELLLRRLKAANPLVVSSQAPASVTPRDPTAPAPVSFSQQRLWFLAKLDPAASVAYHMPAALSLSGALNLQALRQALDRMVARHEILRTTFAEDDGRAIQRIHAPATGFRLEVHDLSCMDESAQAAAVQTHTQLEAQTPFDMERAPPVRGRLLRLAPELHLLYLTQHHIVSDGWSAGLLVRELSSLYSAFVAGLPDPLQPLALQYADYAVWQHGKLDSAGLKRQTSFWREYLRDAPTLLSLPLDKPRQSTQSHLGARVPILIAPTLAKHLREFSRRHGLTLFMTLLAAWSVLLSRLSGQKDLLIGTPVANRRQAELEPLIGFFVNTLALRVRLDEDPTLAALLSAVKASALAAFEHQELPFEQVVELINPSRTLGYNPLVQAHLVLENVPTQDVLTLPGLTVAPWAPGAESTHYDISLYLNDADGVISGQLVYGADLFDTGTIERIAANLKVLLESLVDAPAASKVSELAWIHDDELRRVLVEFNSNHVALPQGRLVHELFEEQVRIRPDDTAVEHRERSLTYGELNARANQVAHRLLKLGVRPDDRVAICVGRSVEMVVGLLAVLKSGAAYVPMDPSYPIDRLRYMLKDSQPVALLTQQHLIELLGDADGVARVVLDDQGAAALATEPTHDPDARARGVLPSHLAYVIYTSGSTGKPKGVMVEHAAWINFLEGMRLSTHNGLPTPSRIAQNAAFSFDGSLKGLSQLLSGHCVVIVPSDIRASGDELLKFIRDARIDVIDCTPLQAAALLDAGLLAGGLPLKRMLIGGENISAPAWEQMQRCESIDIFNMYGPTECTVDVTSGLIRDCGPQQSTGWTMANARAYVLDELRRPVAIGVTGEVYLAGSGLARGYLGQPELTHERFVTLELQGCGQQRAYRTGDLGCWRPDGSLRILGRNDFQVKIRGYRIELGEIEAALCGCEGVREAVVLARADVAGDSRLVAYVTAQPGASLKAAELRARVSTALPAHMLPSAFVILDALPKHPTGKLDRMALPAPERETTSPDVELPLEGTESEIAAIWAALLGRESVGRHDDFFELGGHSILGVQMLHRIRKAFDIDLPLRTLFATSTIAALAREVVVRKPVRDDPHLVAVRPHGRLTPLFLVHPGGGEMYYARNLLPYLSDELPVYGLGATGFREGEVPYTSVQQMARHYLNSVLRVQPTGPYQIAGWSVGGTIAYEMARQLRGRDEEVRFLGLIDTRTSYASSEGDLHFNAAVSSSPVLTEYLDEAAMLLSLVPEGTAPEIFAPLKALAERHDIGGMLSLCQDAGFIPRDVGEGQLRRILTTRLAIKKSAAAYEPEPTQQRTTMFIATAEPRDDPSRGWSALLDDQLVQVPVEGTHYSMVEAPQVQVLGTAIQRQLDASAPESPSPSKVEYDPRITLQGGFKGVAPVICIPGAGANVTSFYPLAKALGMDRPLHGLQPRGLDGVLPPHTDVRAAARAYLPALLQTQPTGPYHLIGHSFGGWVAYALANELAAIGREVATVVAVDSHAPRPDRSATTNSDVFREFVRLYEMSAPRQLRRGSALVDKPSLQDRLSALLEDLIEAGVFPAGTQAQTLRGVWNVFEANVRTEFTPTRHFGGRFVLVQAADASEEEPSAQEQADAWRVQGQVDEIWSVPGNHLTVLVDPNVRILAGRLIQLVDVRQRVA